MSMRAREFLWYFFIGLALPLAISAGLLGAVWTNLPEQVITGWSLDREVLHTERGLELFLEALIHPTLAFPIWYLVASKVPRTAPGAQKLKQAGVAFTWATFALPVSFTVQQAFLGAEVKWWIVVISWLAAIALGWKLAVLQTFEAGLPESQSTPPQSAQRLGGSPPLLWSGRAALSQQALGLLVGIHIVIAALIWFILEPSPKAFALIVVPMALTLAFVVVAVNFKITVGKSQLLVRNLFGPALLGPKLDIAMNTIKEAGTTDLSFASFGGFGIRYRGSTTAIKTRSGKALELTRTDSSKVLITCDNPETAAKTINTFLDQRATNA